jgi:PDZ domain
MDFKPGDVIHAQVTKSDVKQPSGLKLEEKHGRIYVRKVDGLFKLRKVPVQAGDQVLKINGKDVEEYPNLTAVKAVIKSEKAITVCVLRCDPTDEDESTDSERGNKEEEDYPALTNGPHNDDDFEEEHTAGYPSLIQQDDLKRGDNDADEETEEEEEDQFDAEGADLPRLENGSPVDESEIKFDSRLRLGNVDAKPILNGQPVTVKEESARDGLWDVELADGSRVSVRSDNLFAAADDQEFDRDDASVQQSVYSTQSFLPNLIEPGDTMKIRGLKKKAKMNGTVVEVLRASEDAQGRWEVLIVDDPDERVISVASVNLRHIM